jgi:DNA-directed RNA polymerase sigma subunit (sigma70/sigma32)
MNARSAHFAKLWNSGATNEEIAATFRIKDRRIRQIRKQLKLKPRKPGRPKLWA